jgi:pimeloyl-ACP methyl ester carboxylesterase
VDLTVAGRKAFAATGGRAFDPALPGIVFVHGAGMDHTVWALQTRWFAHHGYAVLAVDLPGHGRSEGPALASIDATAAWLLQLLDAAGLPRAALAGHSMGALASLSAAGSAPDRAVQLALLGVAAPMKVHPDLLDAAKHNEPLAWSLVTSWGFGKPAHLGAHKAPGLWMLGGGLRLLGHAPKGVLAVDLAACDSYAGAADAAKRVACPTLYLCGSADIMTRPKQAEALAAVTAKARVEIIEGAGHMMMVERPDDTLDALKAFF